MDPEEAERGRAFMAHYNYLVDGLKRDPKFLDGPDDFTDDGRRDPQAQDHPTADS
jgi:hypothetical protein